MYLGLPILSKNARGFLSSSPILAALLLLLLLLMLSRAKSVSSSEHLDDDRVLYVLLKKVPQPPRNGGLITEELLPTVSNASTRAADESIAATAITIPRFGGFTVVTIAIAKGPHDVYRAGLSKQYKECLTKFMYEGTYPLFTMYSPYPEWINYYFRRRVITTRLSPSKRSFRTLSVAPPKRSERFSLEIHVTRQSRIRR